MKQVIWLAALFLTLGLGLVLGGCTEAPEPGDSPHTPAAQPFASATTPELPPAEIPPYEVWVIDQSDSVGLDHGGTLYVYPSSELRSADVSSATPSTVLNLGDATAALCREQTGANPVRPHMILFNEAQTHGAVAFVASGHVVMFDAASREPLACLRMSKSASGQQAHAAFPSPDGSYVLVANQNGKRLERIDTDYSANRFEHNPAATLDLAECTAPAGNPCEGAATRPDNAPICPVIDSSGDLAFVTLRGGGMLVVDPRPTPMAIVAEYDMATVKGNGCGGIQVGDQMYVNSGGRPGKLEHLHLYGFEVYRFPLGDFSANNETLPPNNPSPVVVHAADGEHDSHGMVATGDGRYLWVMDRHGDMVEVFATDDDRHLGTIPLNGELTDNAAPDLADISPDGKQVYVAFRGPTPLSGDPHIATGTTPGLAILDVTEDGASGRVAAIVRLTNMGADGVERADPHGLRVRRLD